jgi:hypothetical protein
VQLVKQALQGAGRWSRGQGQALQGAGREAGAVEGRPSIRVDLNVGERGVDVHVHPISSERGRERVLDVSGRGGPGSSRPPVPQPVP